MYKIALVCENGASTGLCMRKMIDAAKKQGLDCDINAYALSQIGELISERDCFLFGPQIAFKLDGVKKQYPDYAARMTVIPPMDFGMMDGEKILKDAIALIHSLG